MVVFVVIVLYFDFMGKYLVLRELFLEKELFLEEGEEFEILIILFFLVVFVLFVWLGFCLMGVVFFLFLCVLYGLVFVGEMDNDFDVFCNDSN